MNKDNRKGANSNFQTLSAAEEKSDKTVRKMKEEISLELSELGNLKPKHEPMTPNQRDKSESERSY
ncbi:hypothetical protein [Sporosarcina gallistercoris]|uniref:Uncharacterized protein n=1 Tax=Sporosarcina gallistercoris TaxID=2762245 RepID=A0ABR8PKB0_9BACL|nr:hypothetical protein [Sporosarcina gallistercoris]MBD7908607.1 hypothetical protein [Sporosarcina gallistercoris]